MHWIASIYVTACFVIVVVAVLGLTGWSIYVLCRSLDASWTCKIVIVAFSVWAGRKVSNDGLSWERKGEQSDDREVSK